MPGANIKVVSEHRFVILQDRHGLDAIRQNSRRPWHSKDIVRREPQAYTEGAFDCNAGGFHNGERVTLFHLETGNARRKDEQKRIRTILSEDAVTLSQKGPLRGILVGGEAFCDEAENDSKILYKFLKGIFKRAGIKDVTEIWGRRNEDVLGPTSVMYRADKNRWYVSAQLYNQDDKDVLTLDEMLRTFQKVKLAEGDTLKIGGQTYTARDISPEPVRKGINVVSNFRWLNPLKKLVSSL